MFQNLRTESDREWDRRWMSDVENKASWSKDRSRKVGCVIVDQENVEVSHGWNGFPRKVDDTIEERHQRPMKYLWTEHAERNALYNAARKGRATAGCKSYQALFPCSHCARALIQCGIVEVITVEPDWNDPTYAEEFTVSRQMLKEANISVRFVEGQALTRKENIENATCLK